MLRVAFTLCTVAGTAIAARAQAPPSDLWTPVSASLARPRALEVGASETFWNPAAVIGAPGVRAGVQAIQSSEAVGLTGVLAGFSRSTRHVAFGALVGRSSVSDLVRTSSSPASEPGEIPVYEAMVGAAVGVRLGPFKVAALLRAHDSRLDVFHETGATLDFGAIAAPLPRLTIGAATFFQPLPGHSRVGTRYAAAAQYQVWSGSVGRASAEAGVRYGTVLTVGGPPEHFGGAWLSWARRVTLDAGLSAERTSVETLWRPVLALGLNIGRYRILAARGSGVNDLGATYRIGLDAEVAR